MPASAHRRFNWWFFGAKLQFSQKRFLHLCAFLYLILLYKFCCCFWCFRVATKLTTVIVWFVSHHLIPKAKATSCRRSLAAFIKISAVEHHQIGFDAWIIHIDSLLFLVHSYICHWCNRVFDLSMCFIVGPFFSCAQNYIKFRICLIMRPRICLICLPICYRFQPKQTHQIFKQCYTKMKYSTKKKYVRLTSLFRLTE